MAEIAIAMAASAFQVLFEKTLNMIYSLTANEYALLGGVKQEMEKLEKALIKFREMTRSVKIFKDQATRNWYSSVRCAVNDADRLLEDVDAILKSAQESNSDDHRHQQQVRHCLPIFSKVKTVRTRHNLGIKITSLVKKIDDLDAEHPKLNSEEIDFALKRETISDLFSEVVFGRDDEKEQIVQFLLSNTNTQCNNGLRICAVIGLGGIGKTTLARSIYNDKSVVQNFELKIWVWVSQTFEVKKVMEKIIETVSRETRKFETLETTQNHLKDLLSGKKFLLVLDDVWNEEGGEWDKLKSPLNFGALGSSILLTTRGSDVASTAGAHDQHKVKVLSEDQCWQVFKESAFLEGNEENGMLKMIGKQIAKKCGGLPLAAKSLGGSLRLTHEVHEWECIRDSPIWELPQPCEILPALKLSLENLNSYSMDCFTFCCVFPKGYTMYKEELVQLWMANDLIPSNIRLGLEDMGNKIINDLLLKSFFQVESCPRNWVTMHDCMHDLGLSFRTECFCLQGPDVSKIPTDCQHLFIASSSLSREANFIQTLSKSHPSLRTLLVPYSYYVNKTIFRNLDCSSFFSNLQCLRALDLRGTEIEDLPKSIGKVKDLKYLNLSEQRHLTHLPDSIGALTKLQTLKLRDCRSLTRLSDGITQLVNLRHLDLSLCSRLTCLPDEIAGLGNLRHLNLWSCNGLTHLPDGIGRLTNLVHLNISDLEDNLTRIPKWMDKLVNLQRLALGVFDVGPDNGQRITELQGLNCLEGWLRIRGLEHVRDARKAEAAFLNKKNLSSLSLIWGDLHASNSNSDHNVEGVLEALKPPQSLNKLVIEGYGGSLSASWMKLLENLVWIELRDCTNCERLPPLGQLPLLWSLTIAGMNSLKCINTEFYGSNGSSSSSERGTAIFPSLQYLFIEDMPNLEEWQDIERDSQQTDLLTKTTEWRGRLTLKKCPKLKSLPSEILNFVELLHIEGSDKVIVRSLPRLTFLVLVSDTNSMTSFPATSLQNLDALEDLGIEGYNELTSLPDESLSNLKTLGIDGCDKVIVRSLPRLTRLQLNGEGTHSVTSFPATSLQNLDALEDLTIECYNELTSLPDESLSNLISLKKLKIRSCPALQSVPVMMNSSIVELLHIESCHSLKSLSLQSIVKLHIQSCDSLKSLSQFGLQYASTLESLYIGDCDQLELSSQDFQNLISLRELELTRLPRLISIPDLQHLVGFPPICGKKERRKKKKKKVTFCVPLVGNTFFRLLRVW